MQNNPTHHTQGNILIVDDDIRLRDLLTQYMEKEGFTVWSAGNSNDAEIILDNPAINIDAIILDVMMPDESGVEFTARLREKSAIPILLLTAMGEVEDKIAGLESGADDYLTKPFEPRELSLRVSRLVEKAKLQHQSVTSDNIVDMGEFYYSLDKQELYVTSDDSIIILSTNEQILLQLFTDNINQIISREVISQALNGISQRSVDVQITRLRKKIEQDKKNAQFLRTVRGKGYVLKV